MGNRDIRMHREAKINLQAVNDRCKKQLEQQRETIQKLEDEVNTLKALKAEHEESNQTVARLKTENSQLKTRLFDLTENERLLRDQLNSSNIEPSDWIIQLKAKNEELEELRRNYDAKVSENNDLVRICEELFAEVESKRQQ
eukprot:TRINITY_DN7804_c0_g1_i2.p1 TRINITY_DN7804_c0_g1~~TRINITY_DN7804_c0_g1_i2.p1  ORF type:complete len:142 (-),score=35.15 TRINITY_DN7804_c0_g1_i2:93-518(-)